MKNPLTATRMSAPGPKRSAEDISSAILAERSRDVDDSHASPVDIGHRGTLPISPVRRGKPRRMRALADQNPWMRSIPSVVW